MRNDLFFEQETFPLNFFFNFMVSLKSNRQTGRFGLYTPLLHLSDFCTT